MMEDEYRGGESNNMSSHCGRRSKRTTEKRRRGNRDRNDGLGCPFMTGVFTNLAIQPMIEMKSVVGNSNSSDCSSPMVVLSEVRKNGCSHLVSKFVQPQAAAFFQDHTKQNVSNTMKAKKRSLTRDRHTNSTAIETEVRIEGDKVENIIDEIQSKVFGIVTQNASSIYLKRIRESSVKSTKGKNGDALKTSPIVEAFRNLVEERGRSWKRVRIHECSLSVVEVMVASPHSVNIEEIQLIGMNDIDENDASEEDESTHDQFGSQSRTSAPPNMTCLIISLLKKVNRLKRLVIKDCNLRNASLTGIMDALCVHPNHPGSLEELDLRYNRFSPRAIQSILSTHLRSFLHSLKTIKLRQGIRCVVDYSIKDAIIRGLRSNKVVLESIDLFEWDKSIQYFLDVNRAKRRTVFCNYDRFSTSLWPLILEQATAIDNEGQRGTFKSSSIKGASHLRSALFWDRSGEVSTIRRQASVVYHMFRNGGPMLLEQQSSVINAAKHS